MVEERKKSGGSIIIVILLLCLLGTSGYIVYDKVLSKKEVKEEETEEKKEEVEEKEEVEKEQELDVNSILVQQLYSYVVGHSGPLRHWMYEKKEEFLVSELEESTKMDLVYQNLPISSFYTANCNSDNTSDAFTCRNEENNAVLKSEVERVYKTIFGSDKVLDPASSMGIDFIGNCSYRYVPSNDSYMKYCIDGGGATNQGDESSIKKATKTDKEIKIYEEVVTSSMGVNDITNTYIYTFQIKEDGSYTYYSRKKEA